MYGMSAKDRMSLFEKKSSGSDTKKTSSAPKKIGKLNIGNKKEAEKQPLNKPLAKKIDIKKDKEEKEKKVEEKKVEEKKAEEKKVEEKKVEAKKAEEKKEEVKKTEEKKSELKKAEEKKEEQKKAELKKAEEKKAEEKKEEERKAELKKAEEKKEEQRKAELKKAEEKKAEEKKAEERKAELKKAEEKKEEQRKAELKKAEEKKAEEKKAEERKTELKKAEEEKRKAEEKKAELKKAEEKKAEEKKLAEKKEQEKKMEKPATAKEPSKSGEKKEEPKQPEVKKPEVKDVGSKEEPGKAAPRGAEVKKPDTLKPAVAVVDDLDLDSELEANLGVVSDVELQSPTVVAVGPSLVAGKTETAAVKQAEIRKSAEQQQKPAEAKKPAEPQAKGQVAVENIPPTSLELKPKTTAPAVSAAPKVEQIPKAEVTLKAKPEPAATKLPAADNKGQQPAKQQATPQTEVSVTTKPAPTKQQEPVKKEAAEKKPEPPKAKGEAAKPAQPAPAKPAAPKQEPTKVGEKPKEVVQQNAEDQEVSAILDAALKQEPTKEETTSKKKESILPKVEFKPLPDEFYNTIFYFSGMGTVVGSALAEGVYVAENTARISLDDEEVQNAKKEKTKSEADKEAVIKAARVQASDISVELKHLQNLLDSLPTFLDTDINVQQVTRATDRAIHGTHYPQQKRDPSSWVKRPPQQQQQQQNAIPTWKQQVQDGMAMMGHPPSQKIHPGVQAQPFVPGPLKDSSKKPAVVPQPKVEPPPPPTEQRLRPHEPPKVDKPDAEVGKPATAKDKDRVEAVPAPQAFAPPAPPPPPPLPSKPAGGVAVLPAAPPKAPVSVPSDVHKPGAVRPEPGEFLVRVAGKDHPQDQHAAPGRTREFGVHTADARVPSQPWQERYGKKKVEELPQPRPFGGVINPKGLKTWQLSRLRTLEAQGFDVKQPEDFETYAHIKSSQSEENLASLAPYLVSGRSKEEDFRRLAGDRGAPYHLPSSGTKPFTPVNASSFQPKAAPSSTYKPKSKSISTPGFRSVAAPFSAPKVQEPSINGTLPYCDL